VIGKTSSRSPTVSGVT